MMPGDSLSTSPVRARFVGARSLGVTATVDFEDGGIALNNPSRGLLYQRWRGRLLDAGRLESRFTLTPANGAEHAWFSAPEMTEVSFTFDVNMQPALTYVQGGVARLRWYDAALGGYSTIELPAGSVTPRVLLDDKRFLASGGYQLSDILWAYVRDGNLYYRQQRDRFTIERLLAEGVKPLIKMGFTRALRVQFMHEVEQ